MVDRDRLLRTFFELVSTDSPSGEEEAVAAEVGRRLEALGATIRRDAHGNLIGRLPGEGAPFLLSAHMDTVEPGRGIRPIVDGDRVHTDGSTILGGDPKAGVAAILEGLTVLREAGVRHRGVEVVLTRGEESGLQGSRNLDYSLISAREGVVLDGEGAVNEITDAAPAQYFVDVTVHGRAAHAGVEPEKGRSAILEAARLIQALHGLNGRWPGVTVNVGVIQGGTRPNVVAERCELEVDVRSVTADGLHAVEAAIREIAAATEVPDTTVETTLRVAWAPMEKLERSGRLVEHAQAVAGALGFEIADAATGGASDANTTSGMGVPTIDGLGPIGGNDHSPTEYLEVDSIVPRTTMLAGLLLAIARDPAVLGWRAARTRDAG